MALSHNLQSGEILEKVITSNDLSGLTAIEKVTHIKMVCDSLGLNVLTRPIQLIKFQGKEVMYASKDATEQLRKLHKVSITKIEVDMQNGVYIVRASACTPDGRQDSSTGVVYIDGLKGENLCNAMLKAETKAKRRVTLSICGLGILDESELDTMIGHKKIDLYNNPANNEVISFKRDIESDLVTIELSKTLEDLQESYKEIYKYWSSARDKASLLQIIDAKDKRKALLVYGEIDEEDIDVDMGKRENNGAQL